MTKQLHILLILTLVSSCFFSGCLSELEFDLPEQATRNIAIVANLNKSSSGSAIVVDIKRVAVYGGFNQEDPINNAQVSLLDEAGNSVDVPWLSGGYYYSNISGLTVETGMRYQLNVEVDGKQYESTFERLHPVPEADKIEHSAIGRNELNDFGNIVENRYIQFFINTPLIPEGSSEKVYLKWDFVGVYRYIETMLPGPFAPQANVCYITRQLGLDEVAIFNGPESREETLENNFLLEEPLDHRFSRGFYLNVSQQSMSQGAYEYWDQLKKITDLSGNFFEDPPGKISSNLRNITDPDEEVFGNFRVTQTKIVRVKVETSDYLISPICPQVGDPSDETIRKSCFDCLSESNSTLEKPIYWED